jgi:hypothetical protein
MMRLLVNLAHLSVLRQCQDQGLGDLGARNPDCVDRDHARHLGAVALATAESGCLSPIPVAPLVNRIDWPSGETIEPAQIMTREDCWFG